MTASGHGELPGEQGNANAVDRIGSGQKTAIGPVESGLAGPVSIRGSRPVSPRARANVPGAGAIRRSRPLTAQPLVGGQ